MPLNKCYVKAEYCCIPTEELQPNAYFVVCRDCNQKMTEVFNTLEDATKMLVKATKLDVANDHTFSVLQTYETNGCYVACEPGNMVVFVDFFDAGVKKQTCKVFDLESFYESFGIMQ